LCSAKYHLLPVWCLVNSNTDQHAFDNPPITPHCGIGNLRIEPKTLRTVPPWVTKTIVPEKFSVSFSITDTARFATSLRRSPVTPAGSSPPSYQLANNSPWDARFSDASLPSHRPPSVSLIPGLISTLISVNCARAAAVACARIRSLEIIRSGRSAARP